MSICKSLVRLLATVAIVACIPSCGFFSLQSLPRNNPADPGSDGYATDTTPPGTVSEFFAAAASGVVTLSWQNPADADFAGVAVVYRTDAYPARHDDGTSLYDGSGTTCDQAGASSGTTYYSAAFSHDGAGNFSEAALAVATPGSVDTTAPSAVAGFTATPGDGQVTLSWTNPADADLVGVKVLFRTDRLPATVSDGTVAYDGATGGFSHTGLTNGATYYYAAFAYDAVPNFSAASTAQASPAGAPAALPTLNLGAWQTVSSPLPEARHYVRSFLSGGYVYVVAGYVGPAGTSSVIAAQITGPGSLGGWSQTTPISTARYEQGSALLGGHLYAVCGLAPATYLNSVEYAAIAGPGAVGAWTLNGTSPAATGRGGRSGVACTAYGGRVYLVGGYWDNGTVTNMDNVEYATANADGSLGAFSNTTPLPAGRWRLSAVALGGYLYAIGGAWEQPTGTGHVTAEVLCAPISSDGTVGAWVATAPLPNVTNDCAVVVNGQYLYLIGGATVGGGLTDVVRARAGSDGRLDAWTPVTSLPAYRTGHGGVTDGNGIYVFGGYSAGAYTSSVLYAPFVE
jgi:hypothetical protein